MTNNSVMYHKSVVGPSVIYKFTLRAIFTDHFNELNRIRRCAMSFCIYIVLNLEHTFKTQIPSSPLLRSQESIGINW